MLSSDGFIVVEGGPFHGWKIPPDDWKDYITRPEWIGYDFGYAQVNGDPPAIQFHMELARVQAGKPPWGTEDIPYWETR